MGITLSALEERELRPKITVFGVGGAGGNAVGNMIAKGLDGADFVVANTDAQALEQSRAGRRIQLGTNITQGLGAGMKPEMGREAAQETLDEIIDEISGANMAFITAGMGGGTGTGAAPVIAKAARELGVLTVGVVTKPFSFEGSKRMRLAEEGLEELQQYVDTLIIIPNQNLFRIATENTTIMDAFNLADDVLYQGVKGVTDLMVKPGLINLDFADVRTVMGEMGKAMMGTGEAEGDGRAVAAAEAAIANPLLDDVSLHGARGVLINITGGMDLKLFEVDEAATRIKQEVSAEANIIVGSCFDDTLDGQMRVSVVATGIDHAEDQRPIEISSRREEPRLVAQQPRAASRPAAREMAKPFVAGQPVTPAQRHKVHNAISTPAAAISTSSAAHKIEEEFEVAAEDVQMHPAPTEVEATQRALPLDEDQRAQPFDHPGHLGQSAPRKIVATVVDPSVDQAEAQAAPELPQAPLTVSERLRRAAEKLVGSRTSNEKPATAPFREGKLDCKDGNLDIPAFLRRQAN